MELHIGLLRLSSLKDMKSSNFLLVLWDFSTDQRAQIINATSRWMCEFQVMSQHIANVIEQGDINKLCVFN